ncbi:hypothetical protein H9X57_16555 [Flavobacterium piscinae]|uniref:hypothetical protein n=1 Tax=Flavobacterium piscinae TaxID=2506424 RepID=UPI0019854F37|nr:hypothetical protein [Flavobacterium piscinae]MBC8884398.1 hypothetical protein [Flavobacterium piscinae]
MLTVECDAVPTNHHGARYCPSNYTLVSSCFCHEDLPMDMTVECDAVNGDDVNCYQWPELTVLQTILNCTLITGGCFCN